MHHGITGLFSKRLKITILLFLLLGIFSRSGIAQTSFGTLTGTISDTTGAVVSSVPLTLTNTETGEQRKVIGDASGNYSFVNLIPGVYKLDAQAEGFQHFIQSQIVIQVQTTTRIDLALKVGQLSQSIEVTTQAALLQSDSGNLSTVIEGRQVQQAPLNGRNVMSLVTLVPGVVAQGASEGNPAGNNTQGWGNFQFGGGLANQGAEYFDGVLLNTNYANQPALIPTQDMVKEFSVTTNSTGAEYGNTAGGVVNIASQSGTNGYHGSVYEFIRNKDLNANLFFNKQVGAPRSAFTQNQYGATFGGPIKKDKAFIFFSWEGFALRSGNRYIGSVPTDAQRAGDFSAPGLHSIYDPCAGAVSASGLCNGTPPAKTQFAGNVIPSGRINPVSAKLLALWPHANVASATPVNNFTHSFSNGFNYNQYNVRGDYAISSKQQLFVRYADWRDTRLPADNLGTHVALMGGFQSKQAVVGDTITINASTLVDLRIALTRFVTHTGPQSANVDQTTFGLPSSYNSESNRGDPSPCVTGIFTQFCTTNLGLTIGATNNNYEFVGGITKILGKHSLKAGYSIRRMEFNQGQVNYPSGFFNFDTAFTANGAGTGDAFASFLLGYPTRAGGGAITGVQQGKRTSGLQFYQGYYLTDTQQIGSRITLNYGVRWEIPTAWQERHDSLAVLLPGTTSPLGSQIQDPITSQAIPLKGTMALVNSPLYHSRYDMNTPYTLFAPRLGASFRVSSSTVVRAGYGMFYLPAGVSFLSSPANFSVNNAITNPPFATGSTPVTTMSNPFPNGIQQPGGHSQSYLDSLYGKAINTVTPQQSYPYNQQWNLTVQQQLGGSASVEVAYAGASGVYLPQSIQLDVLPLSYLHQASAQAASGQAVTFASKVSNPLAGLIPNAPSTTTYGQLLLPYPQYLSVQNTQNNAYHSSYQALQAKLEKRFSMGASLLAAYTWSKVISNTDTQSTYLESNNGSNNGGVFQNALDPAGERSVSAGNVPQLLVVSYTLDLPFGHNRRFLSNAGPVVDHIIDGWGANGITTFQSGFPLTLTLATVPSQLQPFNFTSVRPNVVAGCQKELSGSRFDRVNSGSWFNKSCFTAPAAYTLGNEPRVDPTLKMDGFRNFDFALFKNTSVFERATVEFRAEVFNLFNTTRFAAPNSLFGSAAFGTVTAQENNPRLLQFALRLKF